MTARTVSAEIGGSSPLCDGCLDGERAHGRSRRKPRQRRSDPADLVAQLTQPFGVAVGSDIGQPQVYALAAGSDCKRSCTFSIVRIDYEFHCAVFQPRHNRIDQRG